MNLEIITSVIIGCFIYNILLKSLGNAIIKTAFSDKETKEQVKKTFREKVEESARKKGCPN